MIRKTDNFIFKLETEVLFVVNEFVWKVLQIKKFENLKKQRKKVDFQEKSRKGLAGCKPIRLKSVQIKKSNKY